MAKDKVRVIIWGLGAMGKGIAQALLKKKGVEIVGVVVRGDKIGRSIFELMEIDKGQDEDIIAGSYNDIIKRGAADLVILTTDSFVKDSFDKMSYVLERGMNLISTAEEMAYPEAQNKELADKLDELAKKNKVSLLGTGINPGLVMDLLITTLTGACIDVDFISAKRINDLSPFGPTVMTGQGVGLSQKEFEGKVKENKLDGHIGFPESISMVAQAIGWKLSDTVKLKMTPILTGVDRSSQYAQVKAGDVAGCNMEGYGYVDGKLKIEMLHPQQIEPAAGGVSTGDYITIKGNPNINMAIEPEIPGGIGTIAMTVNMIPHIINSRPGLKTMLDLPVPRAIMGDMRDLIED